MSTESQNSSEGIATTFIERRSTPRLPIKIVINYRFVKEDDQVSSHDQSVAHDVAVQGVAIICDEYLPVGQKVILKLFLPYRAKELRIKFPKLPIEADCWTLNVMAQVVWSKFIGAHQYNSGLKLLECQNEDDDLLEDFLSEYQLQ